MEYYSVERKKEFLPFRTALMELENIMLSEISQVVKDKYHMISPISEITVIISMTKTGILLLKDVE